MKDNTYQYYAGNMVYNTSKALDYIIMEEGLIRNISGAFTYEYNLKDHLGNTRVVFKQNGAKLDSLQIADYYPLGSTFNPINPDNSNKYLYNGKEKQDDGFDTNGDGTNDVFLDWYDYGARFYDPMIGRFTGIDPIASEFAHLTPYNYAENKVINCIDLWGLQAVQVIFGARGAVPLAGPIGFSESGGISLIYDFTGNLVLTCNFSLGVSAGAAIGVGFSFAVYPTAKTYNDLLGFGLAGGFLSSFPISVEGDLSIGDKVKGGFSVSGRATAGAAGYFDATFTNLMSNFGNINNGISSVINKLSGTLKISKKQARWLIEFMKITLEKEDEKALTKNSILLPEVIVTAQKKEKVQNERIQDMLWMSARPNSYGNTGRYNMTGRTADQYYSDDFLKWYYAPTNKEKE